MNKRPKQSNNLADMFFGVFSAYQPADINSYEDVVVATAEVIADANFVCPANKFARELTMIGSKVSVCKPPSSLPAKVKFAHHTADLYFHNRIIHCTVLFLLSGVPILLHVQIPEQRERGVRGSRSRGRSTCTVIIIIIIVIIIIIIITLCHSLDCQKVPVLPTY